ncbi:MAG TPA: queuosine precursor transporter [Candidatus Saccharimonadales bacterium]|nr:queuosine precursor transporter [Candidatus Saccharimonadales bacterium]
MSTQEQKTLKGYNFLIFFTMLYMSIMICSAILTNRYIRLNDNFFILGGTLISPLIFILGDIVAEIFGYKMARQMIVCGFICQAIFALICESVVHSPYPEFFKSNNIYVFVFDQLLYIVISSFIAFIISGLINIHIITRWKVLLRGRYFWLRSLGSSTIAEALYSAIAILMMEAGSIELKNVWKIILASYLIKVLYSIFFALPGNIIVNYIKNITNIDIYDYPADYNPFKRTENKKIEPA